MKLILMILSLLVGGICSAQQGDFRDDPLAASPEPSKVWGYVTARNPVGGVWLPGTSVSGETAGTGRLARARKLVGLSNLTIVFKDAGGVEHRCEFVDDPESLGDKVPTHYFKPGMIAPESLDGAIAIRYEVRFAQATHPEGVPFPPTIAPDLTGGGHSGLMAGDDEYDQYPGSHYSPSVSQWPFPLIAYDPTLWKFDRVEIGSLVWEEPQIPDTDMFPAGELMLTPEPVPMIEFPDQPDM